uniref:Uncharacterized protein n=1 Tax=Monopterus albus TaxID=43700 RepID=A0A3Q3JD36_MONAL
MPFSPLDDLEGGESVCIPEDVGIVLEGINVFQDLDNVALAVAILFVLMYALNLSYPPDLCYIFEVVQKIFMELEKGTVSFLIKCLL